MAVPASPQQDIVSALPGDNPLPPGMGDPAMVGALPISPVVGSEAPVSPPAKSANDIFASLGIPKSAIAQLDRAQVRAQDMSTAADAALASSAEERAGLRDQMAGMEKPDAPTLGDLPAPPHPEPTDTLRVFGEMLPVLAMLGGTLSRKSSTAALKAGAAAMQAAKDNDGEALKRANEEWNLNVKKVLADNDTSIQRFSAASQLFKTDMDGALAQLNALAGEEQNNLLRAQLANGDVKSITDAFAMRTNAWNAVQNAYLAQRRINADLEIAGMKARGATSAASAEQQRKANIVLSAIDQAKTLADSGYATTGVGAMMKGVPGTKSADLAAVLDTIGANISFDALSAMRAASPTGGALGSITEGELKLLKSTMASLEQSQSKDQFLKHLAEVEHQYDLIVNGPAGARPSETPGASGPAPGAMPDPFGIR